MVQVTSHQIASNGAEDVINTNPSESEADYAPESKSLKTKKDYKFGPSPFEIGLFHMQPPLRKAEACFKWLGACSLADAQLSWYV